VRRLPFLILIFFSFGSSPEDLVLHVERFDTLLQVVGDVLLVTGVGMDRVQRRPCWSDCLAIALLGDQRREGLIQAEVERARKTAVPTDTPMTRSVDMSVSLRVGQLNLLELLLGLVKVLDELVFLEVHTRRSFLKGPGGPVRSFIPRPRTDVQRIDNRPKAYASADRKEASHGFQDRSEYERFSLAIRKPAGSSSRTSTPARCVSRSRSSAGTSAARIRREDEAPRLLLDLSMTGEIVESSRISTAGRRSPDGSSNSAARRKAIKQLRKTATTARRARKTASTRDDEAKACTRSPPR